MKPRHPLSFARPPFPESLAKIAQLACVSENSRMKKSREEEKDEVREVEKVVVKEQETKAIWIALLELALFTAISVIDICYVFKKT